mgnify:CR=1 FL=1
MLNEHPGTGPSGWLSIIDLITSYIAITVTKIIALIITINIVYFIDLVLSVGADAGTHVFFSNIYHLILHLLYL